MVEALLRTGEIEDMLEDPRARFTGLSIDIGDQDQHELKEYASGFDQRLDRTRNPDRTGPDPDRVARRAARRRTS